MCKLTREALKSHERGHPHITSPPWGEGGLQNDDRGEGGLQNDDIINKGSFLEQYPKKITQSKLFFFQ